MSDQVQKLESKLQELKAKSKLDWILPKTSSSWFSRKLFVALTLLGVLVFLGRDNINTVLTGIVYLGITYLIVQGVQDVVTKIVDGWVRRTVIEAMAKDGLDEAERKELQQ